jgi:probable rRNA maturation factor
MVEMAPVAIDAEVQFDADVPGEEGAAVDVALLQMAVQAAAAEAGFSGPAEMALVITDDTRMQELNRVYRGVDATTDVLAFGEEPDAEARFVSAPDAGIAYLGDVLISLPQAGRQAAERGHPLQSELCLLTVHGVLHLLGHDHAELEEQRRMWDAQRHALRRLGCESAQPEEPA